MADDMEVMTSAEALKNALDWAEGRRSHWNMMMSVEGRSSDLGLSEDERQKTIAWTAQADAQEVVKWSALAVALREIESLAEEIKIAVEQSSEPDAG